MLSTQPCWWTAALLGAALLGSCSNSSDKSNNSNGGSSASGGTAGWPGSGGSSGSGGSAGSGGNTAPGFEGIWKAQSAKIQIVDSASPLLFQEKDVPIPATLAAPAEDAQREVEIYQQFQGDSLIIYAHYAGDSAYYRVITPAQKSGDGYAVRLGDGQHVYLLEDGTIRDLVSTLSGTVIFNAQVAFVKNPGAFPPSSWPQKAVELDAAALAGGQ
jgi:hypothetical protein